LRFRSSSKAAHRQRHHDSEPLIGTYTAPALAAPIFDFISPYTYLARTQLDGIAARTGARFRIWPVHILNLMKIVGNTPTTVVCSNKRKYAGQDIERWCARYQVPLQLNPHLMKSDHSLTLKGALVAQEMNLEDRYKWGDVFRVLD
jgi:2-hydroxychromene-2-carboxylate isomerase